MFAAATHEAIATALLAKGQVLKQVVRDGNKFWAVCEGKKVVLGNESLEVLVQAMEAEARKQPLRSTSPNTHLFQGACTVEFAEQRGDFYLVQGGRRVWLRWMGPGTRWVAFTECGQKLKYGPKDGKRGGEFKLDFLEADRQQPALRAWLA